MSDGEHDHPSLAKGSETTALALMIADHEARLKKLETTTPPPQPPGQWPPQVASGPVVIPSSGLVENLNIDLKPGGTITAADQLASGNRIYGKNLPKVTIRNCTIRGGYTGIQLLDCDNVELDHVTITDVDYAGLMVWGGKMGRFVNSSILRIGTLRNPKTHGQADNAYGVIFGISNGTHGVSGKGAIPTDWLVADSTITDSPLWMLVNAHEATRLTVENMTLRRAPRAVFMAGPITDCIVRNNDIREPVTTNPGSPNGSNDIESVLYSGWNGGSITGNKIGAGYPMPAAYGSNPKPPTVTGNVRV